MKIVLKRSWELLDAETGRRISLGPGIFEVERISNPRIRKGFMEDWLVLRGTKIGAPENFWRSLRGKKKFHDADWHDFEVLILE